MLHSEINNNRLLTSIPLVFLTIASIVLYPYSTIKASETNSFNIKTVIKDTSYPWYEKALDTVYEVNGEQGKTLVLIRGKPYTFKVNTGLKHDVYFSNNESGRGTGVITEGIKNQFIHKGIIHFTPTQSTPKELYYQCQNHPYMGGKIFVVDEGESFTPPPVNTVAIAQEKQIARHNKQAKSTEATPQRVAQQRVGQANATLNASAERIANSQNDKAKALLNRAWSIAEDADAWLAGGDIIAATEDADIVLMLLDAAEQKLLETQNQQ